MQQTGIFQQILDALEIALQPGTQALRVELGMLLTLFLVFQALRVAYAGLWHGTLFPAALALLFRAAAVQWLFDHWPWLLQTLQTSFVTLGLLVGQNSMTTQTFLDPGSYLGLGLTTGKLLYDTMNASMGWTSIPAGIGYFFLWLVYIAAFLLMAINVAIWEIELLLAAIVCLPLIVCLVSQWTSWIGQQSLSFLVNATFRFFLGAVVASASFPLLKTLTVTQPVSFQSVLVAVGAGWIFAMLFMRVNALSSRLLSGLPSFSASTVLRSAVNTALGVGVVASGGAALAGAGAAAGAGVARGALMAGGAVQGGTTAAWHASAGIRLGAATRQIYAGAMRGVGQANQSAYSQRLGQLMGRSANRSWSSGTQSMQRSMQSLVGSSDDDMHNGLRR